MRQEKISVKACAGALRGLNDPRAQMIHQSYFVPHVLLLLISECRPFGVQVEMRQFGRLHALLQEKGVVPVLQLFLKLHRIGHEADASLLGRELVGHLYLSLRLLHARVIRKFGMDESDELLHLLVERHDVHKTVHGCVGALRGPLYLVMGSPFDVITVSHRSGLYPATIYKPPATSH